MVNFNFLLIFMNLQVNIKIDPNHSDAQVHTFVAHYRKGEYGDA